MAIPSKMPAKPPLEYVTALKKCVGIRVNQVDICIKGDISFFGVEQWPDKNPPLSTHGNVIPINGGLATTGNNPSNSVRGVLLPSSIHLRLTPHHNAFNFTPSFAL